MAGGWHVPEPPAKGRTPRCPPCPRPAARPAPEDPSWAEKEGRRGAKN